MKLPQGYEIKDGKIVKSKRRLSVSERLRQKNSKRQRVVSKGAARNFNTIGKPK